MTDPGTWTGIIAGVSALAGGATAVHSMTQAKPGRPKASGSAMQTPSAPTEDTARQKLEEEERLRLRRGRAATLLQGESGAAAPVATTQSGGKTLLGA